MSNIADLNQRIAIANAESKRINNERQVNIGKRETLQQQLDSALQKYEADYGKKLSIDSLDAEINTVSTAKEKEIESIENMLTMIKEGRYTEAEAVVKPEVQTEVNVAQPEVNVAQPVTRPVPQKDISQPIATPVMQEPVVSQPIATPPSIPMSEPTMPVSPAPAPNLVTPPVLSGLNMPTSPKLSGLDVQAEKPKQTPSSFQAILGGTAFGSDNI